MNLKQAEKSVGMAVNIVAIAYYVKALFFGKKEKK